VERWEGFRKRREEKKRSREIEKEECSGEEEREEGRKDGTGFRGVGRGR
jgi:hypothetical protein